MNKFAKVKFAKEEMKRKSVWLARTTKAFYFRALIFFWRKQAGEHVLPT